MTPRMNYQKHVPPIFKSYVAFSNSLRESGLEHTLLELVKLRASQLNGCAFCVDMHVKEATLHGERALRLHHVAIWHESPLFSERERAALAWTEVLTQIPPHGVPDEAFAQVSAQFSEAEVAALSWAIVAINGWNRMGVAFRATPGSADALYGLDKAGLS